jgi:transcriptional regulator with XRE-family HTH domain
VEGNNINYYRKRAKMSQKKLSQLVNVSFSTIRRYENGIREPRASDIKKLAEVLGVTEAELLNGPTGDGEIKFSFVMDMKEVESMDVRMNEFKFGTGNDDIFGMFRVPKDVNFEEIGRRFVNNLRAEMVGDKAKREALEKMEG